VLCPHALSVGLDACALAPSPIDTLVFAKQRDPLAQGMQQVGGLELRRSNEVSTALDPQWSQKAHPDPRWAVVGTGLVRSPGVAARYSADSGV
jgi:hypothetical protein